ncbi:hypothetical protein [Streptomyces lavendofoliae]|uniref:hypothetical protein n=1 Tax=Streptomyces lavendofoliae TaxID=67314 RepID=UPI003D91439A
MGRNRRADRRTAWGLVTTAALCAAACTPPEPSPTATTAAPTATTAHPSTTAGPGAAADAARDLLADLERSFAGRKSLAAGSGPLEPRFGNTHPLVPDDVPSVTFAYACTGRGEVTLTFSVGGEDVPAATGTQLCDGSVSPRSVDLSESGPLGFEAAASRPAGGVFAYAYYAEAERRP